MRAYEAVWLGPGEAVARKRVMAISRETIEREVARLEAALCVGIMEAIISPGWSLWAVQEVREVKAAPADREGGRHVRE